MLSEIYPGSAPKMGSTYWDQIREVAIISIAKRVLKRLTELLEQVIWAFKFNTRVIHALVTGLSIALLENDMYF